jgi:parallel beta-helix repeat protein
MKNPARIRTGLVAALWMFMGTHVMGQGSLTPPGAPGETMKTLEQVEPRTPISSLPYTITESGSYYVTGNLSSTGHGIIIESSGVTVDLMGFSLTGDGGNGDYGIHVDGSSLAPIEDLLIKDGRISGFYDGLYCKYMNNSRINELVVSGNSSKGVSSGQCNGNTIADCTISGNESSGVYLSGSNGNTITDCTISENGDEGVYLSGFSGQCNGNTIADCTISGNGHTGVYLRGDSGQCNGNTITDCTISGNGGRGVNLSGFSGGQCNGNIISDCAISGNDAYGVYLDGQSGQCDGNTIQENMISKNTTKGIRLFHADGNRVEANNVWGTTGGEYGIQTTTGTSNFILKNTCVGNGTNYELDSDDTFGPIVDAAGELGSADGAWHPWANFSR